MDSVIRFVGRDQELAWLKDRYDSQRAVFLVVYGRRRVGKSTLVRTSLDGRSDAVYYQARETSAKRQVEEFAATARTIVPSLGDIRAEWEPLLRHLAERDFIVVIDEFPYLVAEDPSVPSTFQRAWDLAISSTNSTLVLVGSSLSVMEDKVLSGSSPLYGRRTGSLDLGPLSFWDSAPFFPNWSAEQRVFAWSVFGGTPHALQHIDPGKGVLENIQKVVLDPGAPLHEEGTFLFHQEFAQPAIYLAIVEAVASGRNVPNEIAGMSGVDISSVGTYLRKLVRTRLLTREVPVTEDPVRSRKGRYRLADPFLDFWFRFVHQRRTEIALAGSDAARRLVGSRFAQHTGRHFEVLCQKALPHLIPGEYLSIGRWWHDEEEIDVVGLTDGQGIVVAEAKFTSSPMGIRRLYDLERKAQRVRWPPGGDGVKFVFFSRAGFDQSLQEEASKREELYLFDLDAIVNPVPVSGHG